MITSWDIIHYNAEVGGVYPKNLRHEGLTGWVCAPVCIYELIRTEKMGVLYAAGTRFESFLGALFPQKKIIFK